MITSDDAGFIKIVSSQPVYSNISSTSGCRKEDITLRDLCIFIASAFNFRLYDDLELSIYSNHYIVNQTSGIKSGQFIL